MWCRVRRLRGQTLRQGLGRLWGARWGDFPRHRSLTWGARFGGGFGEGGADAGERVGEAGAGEVGLDFGEDAGAEEEGVGVAADGAGQCEEDAVDLGLLFVEQADEFVVLLDGFEGFDKDRLTGGGAAVNDSGDAAAELGFDRDYEAFAADGDEVFLGRAGVAETAQGLAEALFDGAVLAFHGAADAAEFGAGVVGERTVGLDLAAEGFEEGSEVVFEERGGEGGDGRPSAGCGAGPGIAFGGGLGDEEGAPGGYALDDGE